MQIDSPENKKHSILKNPSSDAYSIPRKRISWSNIIDRSKLSETEKDPMDASVTVQDLLAPNLKITNMGLCFVRNSHVERANHKNDVDAMGCQDFASLNRINKEIPRILVIGSTITGYELIADLNHRQNQLGIKFNFINKSNPTIEDIKSSDFFIFLVAMNQLDGVFSATKNIRNLRNHVVGLSICSILVCISSNAEMRERVLPDEYLHNLKIQMQMVSFNYLSESVDGKLHGSRQILEHINEYFTGTGIDNWAVRCPAFVASN